MVEWGTRASQVYLGGNVRELLVGIIDISLLAVESGDRVKRVSETCVRRIGKRCQD